MIFDNRLYNLGYLIKYSREYKEVKNLSDLEKLNNFLNHNLSKLIKHCNNNVPYYQRYLPDTSIPENKIQDLIKKLPILKKDNIIKNFNDLTSTDIGKRNYSIGSTGGSTGEPLKFFNDNISGKWSNIAAYYYYKDIIGIDEPSERKIVLWGSERDLFSEKNPISTIIFNKIRKTKFLNSFRMTEDDMIGYIKIINKYRPNIIRGYGGSLFELCNFADKKNIELHSPKIIVSAAENLNDNMRNQIESVFGVKVYNFYGSREMSTIGGECSEGNIHIFNFKNYFEVLDGKDKPVKTGNEGRFIVTNLYNYSMPFIRYEIGDTAILGTKKCKCGNILPTLKKITGRITNHFILEDGTTIPAEFFIHMVGVVFNDGSIKKYQVIQEDYDSVKILVVMKGEMNPKNRNNIEKSFRLVMGQNCKIIWDYVKDIPKTKSGKFIYTKSLVVNR